MEFSLKEERKTNWSMVIGFLVIAIILRLVLSVKVDGYPTDIACFKGWSDLAYSGGLSKFYTSGVFTDYPPGYVYVLYLIGFLKNVLGIASDSRIFILLIKLPALLCDFLSAALIYKYAKKRANRNVATLLFVLLVMNPAYIVDTAVWAQIDSLLTLVLVLCLVLFEQDKKLMASILYGFAVLIKPQALLFGPVILLPFIDGIRKNWKKGLLETVTSGLAALAVIYLFSLPFGYDTVTYQWSASPVWLLDKYFNTATSYKYATLNAPNLFALTGGNWVSAEKTWFIFNYEQWGTFFVVLAVAAVLTFYLIKRKRPNIYLTAALLLTSIFMLGHFMHERYIFPALLLLLLAYIKTRDNRLLAIFTGFSATMTVNMLYILKYGHFDMFNIDHVTDSAILLMLLAAINMILFGWLIKVCIDHLRGKTPKRKHTDVNVDEEAAVALPAKDDAEKIVTLPLTLDTMPIEMPGDRKLHFTKKDALWLGILMAVYGIIALVNLGSTQVPQTYWRSESIGSTIDISFDTVHTVKELRYYGGIGSGSMGISTLEPDGSYTFCETLEQDKGRMYNWVVLPLECTASAIRLETNLSGLWLHELVFMDENDGVIPIQNYTFSENSTIEESSVAHLFDEQKLVALPSYMTGMYFDEVYHARTAYEHLSGIPPYENSHPPLGKVFIMVGVWIFGMNPFGWRIVGTLFGIGMIPLMYCFGLRLFKKRKYAFLAATIFAFDFMHFAQTRIATIDVYGVFFIIAMLYAMYKFYITNFNLQPMKQVLLPLGTAGVLFGLGAASKWICLYVGAGLAVMLFTYLVKRYREYRYACDLLDSGVEVEPETYSQLTAIQDTFIKKTIGILLFCILFFIIIPVGIYIASYLPYMLLTHGKRYDLNGIIGLQEYMYHYHSTLTASHPYSSQWWQWPVMDRPVWYYMGANLNEGMTAGISGFGNPAVWLGGIVAFIFMLFASAKQKLKKSPGIFLVFTGLADELSAVGACYAGNVPVSLFRNHTVFSFCDLLYVPIS